MSLRRARIVHIVSLSLLHNFAFGLAVVDRTSSRRHRPLDGISSPFEPRARFAVAPEPAETPRDISPPPLRPADPPSRPRRRRPRHERRAAVDATSAVRARTDRPVIAARDAHLSTRARVCVTRDPIASYACGRARVEALACGRVRARSTHARASRAPSGSAVRRNHGVSIAPIRGHRPGV